MVIMKVPAFKQINHLTKKLSVKGLDTFPGILPY